MSRFGALVIVVALTIAGFALRLYRINAVPLRGDEAFSVTNWARQPLAESLARTATREPHPPLTYVLFRGWGLLVGTSEFSMRLLPALFNVLGVPALFALGNRLGGQPMGLLAALLWAIHPYEIWHAQDARNYAIWAGMSAVALWLGLRALATRRPVDWLLYGLAATLAIQIYYLELFTLVALGLYVAITQWRDRRLLGGWLALQAFIVATTVLSFLVLQGQLFASNGYGGTAGQGLDVPRLFTWFLPSLMFGEKMLPVEFVGFLWPIVLAVILLSLILLWRRDRNKALLLALLGFLPLALIGIVSLRLDVFRPHYVLSAVPAYVLIFSALVLETCRGSSTVRAMRRFLPWVLVGGWLAVAGYSLYNYYFVATYAKASNWPALTTYLQSRLEPTDLVIQTAVDAAFGFYYDAPNDDIALPADPQQSPQEIIRILDDRSKHYRSIWLVGQTFPDWPNVGVVEAWMQTHLQLVRRTQVEGLRIEQYMPWQVRVGETVTSPQAIFANLVELVGVNVFTPPEPTGELTVWAYWHPLRTSDMPLKVFVHLLGATNPTTETPLWTQDDQFPQEGRLNTTNWLLRDVYRDVYTLPVSSVPAGSYRLVIGFYDPDTGERLSVNGSDSYTIQSLQLP
jgi:4-amino-4-deoxy-L-arabinose transferase-like glycosyltransferase